MVPQISRLKAKLVQSLDLWRKVMGLLRFSSRWLGIAVFCLTLLEIALTLGGLFVIKTLVETIAGSDDLRADIRPILINAILVLGLFLAGRITNSVANYYRSAQGFVVTDYVNRAIQERAVAADLSFYDSSLYYDSLQRARQAGAGRPAQVIANVLNVVRGGLLLGAIIVIIVTIEWRLLPVSLIAVVLIMIVQIRFTRERFERQRKLVPKERASIYADHLMTHELYAKEIRLWDLGAYLRDIYMRLRVSMREQYLAIERRKALSESAVALVGTLLFMGATGFMLYRFSTEQATLSDLVMVILLLLRAETAGRNFVSSLSALYDDQLYLIQLFRFLELKPEIEAGHSTAALPAPTDDGVQLHNVSFRYPEAETFALQDVSLQLRPGRFTALVGGNGSGKTTLIKILCRLYDPYEGTVTYNGVDVRSLDPLSYRKQFSVIFQDFVKFAFTGRDNLRVSELGQEADAPRLERAATLTGAHEVLEELPKGYDTILSRMFDGGVELSGGQWQKVALARAVFPTSKFVILDEPTSAIDPNAEAELFEGFRDKLEGRGALVISHRLSTIRMADYTYVLDKGRIAEEGTHDELLAKGGRYAQMFERQGRGYRS